MENRVDHRGAKSLPPLRLPDSLEPKAMTSYSDYLSDLQEVSYNVLCLYVKLLWKNIHKAQRK